VAKGTNWNAAYYNSIDLSGPIVYAEVLRDGISVNWGFGSPSPLVNKDNFSARITSVQLFEEAIYEFVITSEAGIRVFINERVVLDNFYERLLETDRFRIRMMNAGTYSLKIEYFAGVGQAAIHFFWFNANFDAQLEQSTVVTNLWSQLTSDSVKRAILDAELLLQSSGAASAIDRVHTGLHGYLRLACDGSGIPYKKDDSIIRLLKLLQQQHPVFLLPNPRKQETEKILNAFGAILDTFNSLRNHASLAHPNPTLLEEEDAMLAINAARTILHYLDAKFKQT
jgi:hypothetical protein